MTGLRGTTWLSPILPLNRRGETFFLNWEWIGPCWHQSSTLSARPHCYKAALSPSNNTVQIVGISNKSQQVSVSKPSPFCLGPFRESFLVPQFSCPYLFLRPRLPREVSCHNFCLPKREIILKFDSNFQNSQLGELNGSSASFICSVSEGNTADSGVRDHLSLLDQLPSSLWANSSTDTSKTHSAPPIKINQNRFPDLLSIP